MYSIASRKVATVSHILTGDTSNNVYYSSDEGATWTFDNNLGFPALGATIGSNGMGFIGSSFATIYYSDLSTAMPRTWTQVKLYTSSPTPASTHRVFGISTIDGVNLIAVVLSGSTTSRSYYSKNSAVSWKLGHSLSSNTMYCVAHGDSLVAIAGGSGSYVGRTLNGGKNWTTLSVFSSGTETVQYQAISFLDTNTAFLSAISGKIYRTLDQGSSWTLLFSSSSAAIYSISMQSLTYGIAGAVGSKGIYSLVPGKFLLLNILF